MFEPQLAALRFSAKVAARRARWGAVGGICVLIALVFFGVAAWIVLEESFGALQAALILGGGFLVVGILAFLWSRYPPRFVPKETAQQMSNPMQSPSLSAAALVNALVMGVVAGRAVRKRD